MSVDCLAAVLVYDTPDLADAMREALPGVFVVDNGSIPAIRGADLRLPANYLFSGGWNRVAEKLKGRAQYLWMLNSDVRGVSDEMMRALRSHAVYVASPVFTRCNHGHMRWSERRSGVRRVKWVDWVAPLVDLKWFLSLGGFDERLPGYGADIDLCYRACGAKLVVDRDLVLDHEWGETVRRTGVTAIHQMRETKDYLVAKHGPAIKQFAPSFFSYRRR